MTTAPGFSLLLFTMFLSGVIGLTLDDGTGKAFVDLASYGSFNAWNSATSGILTPRLILSFGVTRKTSRDQVVVVVVDFLATGS